MVNFVFLWREGEEVDSPKFFLGLLCTITYFNTVSRNMLDVEQG
jgi:hypothetical protein